MKFLKGMRNDWIFFQLLLSHAIGKSIPPPKRTHTCTRTFSLSWKRITTTKCRLYTAAHNGGAPPFQNPDVIILRSCLDIFNKIRKIIRCHTDVAGMQILSNCSNTHSARNLSLIPLKVAVCTVFNQLLTV